MNDEDAHDSITGMKIESHTANAEKKDVMIQALKLRRDSHKREIRRMRNTASWRLGVLLTTAVRKPWLLLILPISIPLLILSIGLERLGKKPVPFEIIEEDEVEDGESKNCVVIFPTNGVGFGHFTRMYSLARRLKKESPDTEIVFFTTMPTIHLLYNDGFPTYHLAGRKKHKDMEASEWNALVEEQMSMVFSQHKPSMFIFDGAFPYRGMLNAIRQRPQIKKIWMRRGTFKKGSSIPIDSIEHFDLIIHPEDSVPLAQSEVQHQVEVKTCSPMILLDSSELLEREKARIRLGLELEQKVVYVQLGAGRINDIDSEVRLTVEALLEQDVTVVLGESMLGERLDINLPGVKIIRDYPNSMYFRAFDATVQAGGYNSFHETRAFGLPALFYPNMQTGMDDQLARCMVAEQEGWGLVVKQRNAQTIEQGIADLLQLVPTQVKVENGADELARHLSGLLTK